MRSQPGLNIRASQATKDARAGRLMNDEPLIGRMFEAGAPLPEPGPFPLRLIVTDVPNSNLRSSVE